MGNAARAVASQHYALKGSIPKKFWVNKCVPEMNRKITRLVENDKKEKLKAEENNRIGSKKSTIISEAISSSEDSD